MTAQCLVSCLITAYYHRFDEPYNELRYDAQFYGDAYYIGLAGLISSAITLVSVLGEESPAVNYMVRLINLDYVVRLTCFSNQNSRILISTRRMAVSKVV